MFGVIFGVLADMRGRGECTFELIKTLSGMTRVTDKK